MEIETTVKRRLERINALFNRERPDRVPLVGLIVAGGGFSMINCGHSLLELQSDPQKAFEAELWTHEQYDWDVCSLEPNHTVYGSWDFGAEMRWPEDEYSFAIAPKVHGVNGEEEVMNLELPDSTNAGAIPKRLEYAKLLKTFGFPVGFNSRTPFSMAADICPIEQFARWLMKDPPLCERLIQMAIDHTFNVLSHFVRLFGADHIIVGLSGPNESNQLFSPRLIEKYALPYHKEYQKRLRELGVERFIFHICGEQKMNLPILSKFAAGADSWRHPSILSFGHEVDLENAAKHFPEDIIQGNIDPALIQFGKPNEIYERARACILQGKKIPGGFILSTGCDLPPRAPARNVWMMTKAIHDFGWYD